MPIEYNPQRPTNPLFRDLSNEETKEFRQWARDTYKPGSPINPTWHPVTRQECNLITMIQKLETLITETTNLARERGHEPKVVRRGRSLRSRPPSAIVECEQCPLIANLITLPYRTERKGTLTQVCCIVATKENK